MGRHHVRICSEAEGIDLVGVADPDPDARSQIAARYHTTGYAGHHDLLDAEKVDFVVLSVPPQHHHAIACDLIERGISTLVEKPISLTVGEGQDLVERAAARGVTLGVGHVERFNPAVISLERQLNQNVLGRVFQLSAHRIGGFPPRVRDVGVALDLATHDLDLMLHLIPSKVVRLSAETVCVVNHSREDLLCGLLRFENGVIGLLDINWLSPTKIRQLVIHGERGMFVVNYLTQDLYYYESEHKDGDWDSLQVFRGVAEGRMVRLPVTRREPLQVEWEAFAHAVRRGEPFPVSGEDGVRALGLAHELVKAGTGGRWVQQEPIAGE
jgi:UDP-N-acetylglucosamine 3-dehydrogenase